MTRGDSQSAWERCLPIWHSNGGIDDRRGIIGQPFYAQSRGVRLAKMFAKRHSKDATIFLGYTQNTDPVTAICAIDLLVEMAIAAPRLIPILTASQLPVSESLNKTLTADAEITERPVGNAIHEFKTVGSYFRWQFESD